jgi:hypothetical protein
MVAVFVTYFFYYFSGGPDFGARYWYLMIVPLVALTARGIQCLGEQLDGHGVPRPYRRAGEATGIGTARALLAVLALSASALVNYFPWRAIDKYHHYLGMRPDIRELAAQYDFGASLVLIRGVEHPDYSSAAVYNPVDLRALQPIYAWDRTPEVRARLLEAYRERPVWVVDGPSITGGRFRVAAGPIPAPVDGAAYDRAVRTQSPPPLRGGGE